MCGLAGLLWGESGTSRGEGASHPSDCCGRRLGERCSGAGAAHRGEVCSGCTDSGFDRLVNQVKTATCLPSACRHLALLEIMEKKCSFSKLNLCQGERNLFLAGYLIV